MLVIHRRLTKKETVSRNKQALIWRNGVGDLFPSIFLLLLLLLITNTVMQRDRILVMVGTGPEPENTVSEPEFMEGAGTLDDPIYILEPGEESTKAGESTITNK